MEQISPELVLVDPDLRARLAELPSGPVFLPKPVPVPAEPVATSGTLLGRMLASAAAVLIFLALPLLAIASDLVRHQPRLAPVAPPSGHVQVRAQQHVRPHPAPFEVRQR